jgi:HNH endonuclease
MTVAKKRSDWKNPAPVRDKTVFQEFHASGYDCISCGHGIVIEAHHILSRAQGGDDMRANLVPLCQECHRAYHGNPYTTFGVRIDAAWVRRAIGHYIGSEPGEDTRWYLTAKLGGEGSQAFLDRLDGTT